MAIYHLPYGHDQLSFALPDALSVTLLAPPPTPPAPDPLAAVRVALSQPVGDVRLSDFAGARRVAIAISDKTRPVPHHLLLPPLLAALQAQGIGPERITLIIGNGTHPPTPAAAMRSGLGVAPTVTVLSHDCDDAANLVYAGETSRGTPVWVNRQFAEADVRMVVGNLEPHQFQGYSGGVKGAAIGLAGRTTINVNHSLMTHPHAQLGRYDDNPPRQDVEDIGRIMAVDFVLDAIINQDKQLVKAVAGDPWAVMQAGIPLVAASAQAPVAQLFDLVITSPGGHPKDINLYQAQKALAHAALVTRDGGFVILAAACPEGGGSRGFEQWVRQRHSLQDVIDTFRAEGFRVGPHKAFQLARDASRVQVRLVSEMPAAQVQSYLLNPAPDLSAAIAEALAALPPAPRVGIMPRANATVPVLRASG